MMKKGFFTLMICMASLQGFTQFYSLQTASRCVGHAYFMPPIIKKNLLK